MRLCELHTHLYGCFTLEDLRWLASRSRPRWHIYEQSYERLYGQRAPVEQLFRDSALLERHYYYLSCDGFAAFQVHFDLVIALSHSDAEEIREVSLRIAAREQADHVEYRMLFPLSDSDQSFIEKLHAFCEALAAAERENSGKRFCAVISLHREGDLARRHYHLLRGLMNSYPVVAKYLVGVDFCSQEEHHPPRKKRELFQEIQKDNRNDPAKALAILYHVGESFGEKSLESAVRWVVQAAEWGCHRLGHAVALGIDPNYFRGTVRLESIAERIDQIHFERNNAAALMESGYPINLELLAKEYRYLKEQALLKGSSAQIPIAYNEKRVKAVAAFQEWAISFIRQSGAVIECCPTSNIRICQFGPGKIHPLARFLRQQLAVVIGADDPGILHTNLAEELDMVSSWQGVGLQAVQQMMAQAWSSTSEKLSGRPL